MSSAAEQLALIPDYEFEFFQAEREIFRDRPRPDSLVAYAQENIYLPRAVTKDEGYFQITRTPYLARLLETWLEPWVRRIVFCAAPQTGKSLFSYLPLLYAMDHEPDPALLLMADMKTTRNVGMDYLIPILRASPALARLLSPNKDDTSTERIKLRNGMRLYLGWTTSDAAVKTFPAKYGVGDEVDDWPESAGKSGDPDGLFKDRFNTYSATYKQVLISSPKLDARGIWPKLQACQIHLQYLAECPHCGVKQRMVWPRFLFDSKLSAETIEQKKLAAYVCAAPECESHWDDEDRNEAIALGKGEWMVVDPKYVFDKDYWDDPFPQPPAELPERPISVGAQLAGWYSKMVPLSQVVAEFLRANRKPDPGERREAQKRWTNSYPARPWLEEKKATVEKSALLRLRDDRPQLVVPSWAVLLTAGVDTQDYGLWYALRAWGLDLTSALVRYGFLPLALELGDGKVQTDFDALELILRQPYLTPDGTPLHVRFGLQDLQGHRTDRVYAFCRRVGFVTPSRGEQAKRTPITYGNVDTFPGSGKLIPGGLQIVNFDTTVFKNDLSHRLATSPTDPGAWLLHKGTLDDAAHAYGLADYLHHFEAEYRDEKTGLWTPRTKSHPNHLWDAEVLNLVAAKILETRGVFTALSVEQQAAPAPKAEADRPNPVAGRNLNPFARR